MSAADSPSKEAPIRLLESDVIDQIAAGEVVERPAHMVKELVENAIDAGATSVEIEYDQGGRRVRVTDNGSGISPESLSLALARHATSKIASADDLWRLGSFGFRGEALASIAGVSRLSLQSRPAGAHTAFQVLSEFGKISAPAPVGGNPGTSVFVEELFSNVPARLKFLKTEAGESAQIKNTLRALALANENVEFRVKTKNRLESVWPATGAFLERAGQIVGAEKLFENEFSLNGFTAQIAFASPHEVTGNARSIQIFVQKRWVQDKSLQAAVNDAYRGLLMHGEFPIAVVRLTAPMDEIDVNIHPTKSQVKFRDPSAAFRAVNRCLREALERAPWLERGSVSPAQAAESSPRISIAELTRPYQAEPQIETQPQAANLENAPVHSTGRFEAPEFQAVMFRQKQDVAADSSPKIPAVGVGPWSRLQVLGQAHLTYIIAQADDRLVLVDQHAAHERVAYERLMRAWQGGTVEVQPLLLPLSIELEPDGAEALMGVAAEMEKLGVSIDQSGPQTVAIRARPVLVKETALVKALSELAREIVDRGGGFALEKKISDLCASMACHSVVRAGQSLSHEQMRSLLEQMDEFSLSSFCPHGRPVSVDYLFTKLERDFGRIV